jgi:Sulfotransferase family
VNVTPSQPAPHVVSPPEKPCHRPWRGPLFVAGTWRSGTSLIYALLNKHPQIALMYEGDLFLLRPLFWAPGAGSRWLARWEFYNGAVTRHRLDTARIPLNISRLATAIEKAYQEYARQKGALIWGEKSVHMHHAFGCLVKDFPDARFIFLWRDLAAICGSVERAKDDFFLGRNRMTERTLARYKILKTQCDCLAARGVPVHQVHYETLVKDPAGVMAEVCKFLDVPFVPEIASLEGADRSAIYEGAHHALVRSERIVSSLDRSEAVPADLKRKIERYISLWREESGGEWPVLAPPLKSDSRKPSLRERLLDRALYRWLRTYDSAAVLLNCFMPYQFLSRFRLYKSRFLHRDRPGTFWLQ